MAKRFNGLLHPEGLVCAWQPLKERCTGLTIDTHVVRSLAIQKKVPIADLDGPEVSFESQSRRRTPGLHQFPLQDMEHH
jgi:hypothetical protein